MTSRAGQELLSEKPDLWLYCEKCGSSYRSTYWCACWDIEEEAK